MKPIWIANTNQGYMVGDYTSTSFTGDGKAHTVFSLAKPPAGGSTRPATRNNSRVLPANGAGDLRHHRAADRADDARPQGHGSLLAA